MLIPNILLTQFFRKKKKKKRGASRRLKRVSDCYRTDKELWESFDRVAMRFLYLF